MELDVHLEDVSGIDVLQTTKISKSGKSLNVFYNMNMYTELVFVDD